MIQKRQGAHTAPKRLSLWSSLRRKAEVCFRLALLLQTSAVPALGLPLFVPHLQGHSPTPGSLWGFPSQTLKVAALSPWYLQSHILSKLKSRLDSLEATQWAPRDPRRGSRGECSPLLPLEARPDSKGESGVQSRDACLPLRGLLGPGHTPR